MAKSRAVRYVLWAVLALAPVLSVLIVGAATSTNVLSIDAWNSSWNDELFYNRAIRQMREVGMPSGMAGYNEVPAPNPSYGTYSMFIYIPYYLGSLITGCSSHNFMYFINMGLGVIACLAIIVVLRPDVRESLMCIAMVLFGFIVSRFLCSGMTEGSYVLFSALFASCAIYVSRRGGRSLESKPKHGPSTSGKGLPLVIVAFAVMIVAVGFWGAMRPYILAFMLVVWALLLWADCGFRTVHRVVLIVVSVLMAIASLAAYLYLSKYYMAPYFEETTLGNGLFEAMASGLPDVLDKHVRCLAYVGKNLLKLGRLGVMLLAFALTWVVLVVMAVKAVRGKDACRAALFIALAAVGFVVFEAHMLIYTYAQMHRTMIPLVIVNMLVIIWHGSALLRSGKPFVPAAVIVIASVACAGSMMLHTHEFALPQVKADYDANAEAQLLEELEQLMPRSDDRWDNTLGHPNEYSGLHVYYTLPVYLSTNALEDDYLEQAATDGTLKSKYICMPDDSKMNALMEKRYKIIYSGQDHIIYQVRD